MKLEKLKEEVRELTRDEMLQVFGGASVPPLTGTGHSRTDAGASTHDDYSDADA